VHPVDPTEEEIQPVKNARNLFKYDTDLHEKPEVNKVPRNISWSHVLSHASAKPLPSEQIFLNTRSTLATLRIHWYFFGEFSQLHKCFACTHGKPNFVEMMLKNNGTSIETAFARPTPPTILGGCCSDAFRNLPSLWQNTEYV
jgi:hypothetical protein